MATTLESASHCPRCGNAGLEVLVARGNRPGSKVHTFNCENSLCRWYKTGWVVQVNEDGSVPERGHGEKDFPTLTRGQEAFAQRALEELKQRDLRGE